MFLCLLIKAQHIQSALLISNADSIEVAIPASVSAEASPTTCKTGSTSGITGFIVNTKPRKYGQDLRFTQFDVNIKSIILNFSPFSWNAIIKQSVDSFLVQRLPFEADAFLHVGVKRYFIRGQHQTDQKQKYVQNLFADMYWRPYLIGMKDADFRFQTLNLSTGYQCGYMQKDVPVLGLFYIAPSVQLNYLYVSESEQYLNSYKAIAQGYYNGNNYLGTGIKLTAQTQFINIYTEIRQYWALDKEYFGNKFTTNPTLLVGAFVNGNLYTKKRASHRKINYQ